MSTVLLWIVYGCASVVILLVIAQVLFELGWSDWEPFDGHFLF